MNGVKPAEPIRADESQPAQRSEQECLGEFKSGRADLFPATEHER
jgi:hypothetical protein